MDDVMTIAEIETRFESEWVLLEDPETNEALEVQSGKVRWHSKDRDEVYRKAIDLRPKKMTAEARAMVGRRIAPRSCIFVEVSRVDGPAAKTRAPGITPGPVIQLGSFNSNALENEVEMSTWYARSRLPLMAPMTGCVGARKLVSISGWARHAILYEFTSLEAVEKHFVDTEEWSRRAVKNLIHAPHSPSLGMRIWPPA